MTVRYWVETGRRALTRLAAGAGFALCAVSGGWAADAPPDMPVAHAVTIEADKDRTRVEIDFSTAVDPELFTLADDYRLVMDMPEIRWEVSGGANLLGQGLVKGLRYARNRPGRSRLVLDLGGPTAVTHHELIRLRRHHIHRLVVELEPTSREDFMRTAGWPARHLLQTGIARAHMPGSDRTAYIASVIADHSSNAGGAAKRTAKPVIVIDAGHGGRDPGSIGVIGTHEKDITLDAALELRDALEESSRYKVYMTRDRDVFVDLGDRVAFAREKKAALFISLHADTNPNQHVRGTSIYTLSEKASDKAAARQARRENAITGLEKDTVTDDVLKILIELAQRDTMNNSVRFAQYLVPELEEHGVRPLGNTHRFGPFYVLTAADVPSVLIEMGFLSSKEDTGLMTSKTWRAQLAEDIRATVDRYFGMEEVANLRAREGQSAMR